MKDQFCTLLYDNFVEETRIQPMEACTYANKSYIFRFRKLSAYNIGIIVQWLVSNFGEIESLDYYFVGDRTHISLFITEERVLKFITNI